MNKVRGMVLNSRGEASAAAPSSIVVSADDLPAE
jgi:hypothetical protein